MILHRVQVTHWRSLLGQVDPGVFDERINVVHAPNGTGKSSCFEAVRRALFDSHQVSGQDIEAVRPWGRSLTPEVEVEFSSANTRYRIRKRFLDSPSAALQRFEQGRFIPLAEGREADKRLRLILGASDAPGRGVSKPEHWGWAQALWPTQGSLRLDSLAESLASNLRTALGAQASGAAGSRLEQFIAQRYAAYFAGGGKLKRGQQAPLAVQLRADLVRLHAEEQQCLTEQHAFEEASRRVEDAGNRRAQLRLDAAELRKVVETTRHQVETSKRLESELERHSQAEKHAAERHAALEAQIDLLATTRAGITERERRIAGDEKRLALLTEELSSAQKALDQANRAKQDAAALSEAAEKLKARLDHARDFIGEQKLQAELRERIDRIATLTEALRNLKTQRGAILAPARDQLERIRTLHGEIAKARASLEASLIHLRVEPKTTTAIRSHDDAEPREARPGEILEFTGSPVVEIEIEGFGSVRAYGPEGEAPRFQSALNDAEARLEQLTRDLPTQDPIALQRLVDSAADLDRTIENEKSRLTELLANKDAAEWESELARVAARLQQHCLRFPAWASEPPDVPALEHAYDEQRRSVEEAGHAAETGLTGAQAALTGIEKRRAELTGSLTESQNVLAAEKDRLQQTTGDGKTDTQRHEELSGASLAWSAAKEHANQASRQLEAQPAPTEADLARLEAQLHAIEESEARARDEENVAAGQLAARAAGGSYSKLAACEEAIAACNHRLAREELQMEAVRLLHDTVAERKAAAIAAVARPAEEAATRMLARIAGPRLGSLVLAESFAPDAIRPASSQEPVALDNLSGGEQEQLFLITRLALGQVLAKEERMAVVLDDVLTATDAGRLARMLGLLEEAADSLQLIVLTCHPERYRALSAAKFLELKSEGSA